MIATTVGASMGRRLGWSDDRIDAIRGMGIAAQDAGQDGSPAEAATSMPHVAGCDRLRAQLARLQRMATLGEPEWAREFMRHSGRSASSYAMRARAMRLQYDARMRPADLEPAASAGR